MKDNKLISIIVPIYNVEKYLKKCIDSIINQTYTNLEIILVDDGSKDNSGKICDEYAKKDIRIKTIHKKNEGVSETRNVGLKVSTGEYIGFVDPDDYIEKDMYEVLIKNLEKENADISIISSYEVYENKIIHNKKDGIYLVMNSEETIIKMNSFGYFGVGLWDKLYKKDLFKNLDFPKGKKSEDWYIIYKLIDKARKIVYDSIPKYYYYQRNGSITHSSNINYDSIQASKQTISFIRKKYPRALKSAYTMYIFANIGVYDKLLLYKHIKDRKVKMKKIRKEIKENYKNIEKDGVSKIRYIQLQLIKFFPVLYNIIFQIYYNMKKI